MIRSLRTGVTGLRTHQARMDVIGNNIANVNTTAFKRSRVAFSELLGQQMLGVGRLSGGSGINPANIGLGVGVSSIDQNWSQGVLEYTNLGTDLAIKGDGFFVVRGGADNSTMLTRGGDFGFNAIGELVTSSGLNVQGWGFEDDGSLVTGALENVKLDLEMTSDPRETGEASIMGNLSADVKVGDPAVTTSTVVYDSQGKAHKLLLEFTKVGADDWQISKAELAGTPATPLTLSNNVVQFDNKGKLTTAPTLTITAAAFPNTVGDDVNITLDLAKMTQLGGSSGLVPAQDGQAPGQLNGYAFTPEGVLMLNFSNGEQKKLFQLALADVPNPNGLEQRGENLYSGTAAAGDMVVGRPGGEIRAAIVAGALEMSNVDLANEFTDMIVTQRGYQASARVITTSDELLQEVVQLKR